MVFSGVPEGALPMDIVQEIENTKINKESLLAKPNQETSMGEEESLLSRGQ